MPKKHTVRQLIRFAMIYAEQDREGYLDSIQNCVGHGDEYWDKTAAETKQLIQEFRAYRKKHYGLNTLRDTLSSASMPLDQAIREAMEVYARQGGVAD